MKPTDMNEKYASTIYLLLKGDLTDWEKDFLTSVFKKLSSGLSGKQIYWLDKIINKYFGE